MIHDIVKQKLYKSTPRQHLKWPRSNSRRYLHWQIPYLTLKVNCQCHSQGQSSSSHWGPRFKLICSLFVSWRSDHFYLRYSKFHIWPWKSQGQDENRPISNQVIYRPGPSILPKMTEKLFGSRQEALVGGGGGVVGGGVRIGRKHKVTPGSRDDLINDMITFVGMISSGEVTGVCVWYNTNSLPQIQ